jgi:hypothetical protein
MKCTPGLERLADVLEELSTYLNSTLDSPGRNLAIFISRSGTTSIPIRSLMSMPKKYLPVKCMSLASNLPREEAVVISGS